VLTVSTKACLIVRSRVLIGVGAWLLGAAAATTGSLYTVDQLGQGLLAQHSKQVTVAMVNAELALENPEQTPATASPSPSASRHPRGHSSAPRTDTSAGELLTSPDGWVIATCQPAGAYLVYESPQQGYEADHLIKGPGAVASVVFRASSGTTSSGVIMKVTCVGGQPEKQLTPFKWGGKGDN
jgi:hypothetical protein